MQKAIVDRIEGEFAVVEYDTKMVDIPLTDLPHGIKVGDVITLHSDSTITIDEKGTKIRKERIAKLMSELWDDKD